MRVSKNELLQALEKVKPGLANKEIIEQSTSFAFLDGKVVTYNDEISVSHPVEGLEGITGAVRAQELYQLISKLDKETIHLMHKDNEVVIKAGRSEAGLILEQEVRLPLEELGEIKGWKELPEGFTEALKFCYPVASKDMSRPVLTCVHVRQDGKIEASDNYRLVRYSLSDPLPVKTTLIPATSVAELVKYDPALVAEGQGWVHFKTEEGTVYSCRVYDDNYPDVEPILDFEGVEVQLPEDMIETLDRSQIFAKSELDDTSFVKVTLDKGKLMVSAQQDYGWYREKLPTTYDGQALQFMVNPIYLQEMLKRMTRCTLGTRRLRFQGDNWQYVIALAEEQ